MVSGGSPDRRTIVDCLTCRQKCGACGRQAHQGGAECPAKGQACLNCGKMGHFRAVCRQKPKVNGMNGGSKFERGKDQEPKQVHAKVEDEDKI